MTIPRVPEWSREFRLSPNPVEQFVYMYQPAMRRDADSFRADLQAIVDQVYALSRDDLALDPYAAQPSQQPGLPVSRAEESAAVLVAAPATKWALEVMDENDDQLIGVGMDGSVWHSGVQVTTSADFAETMKELIKQMGERMDYVVNLVGPDQPEYLKLRPEVLKFAEAMEKKLQENGHKGGWSGMTIDDLALRMEDELLEMLEELDNAVDVESSRSVFLAASQQQMRQRLAEEAVDVANFAMMINERALNGGRLE